MSHQLERLDSQESQGNLSQEKYGDVELSPSKLPPDEQQEDSDYEFDNVDWPGDDIVPENMVTYSQEQQKNYHHLIQIPMIMKHLLIMKLINQTMLLVILVLLNGKTLMK